MDNYEIISTEKDIIIKKFNDISYSIDFNDKYDKLSNFIEIINNKQIGYLLYELNKDLINDYKNIDNNELLIFDKLSINQDNEYYLYFTYNIEDLTNIKKLNIELKDLNNDNYEKLNLESLNIYVKLSDDNISFQSNILFNNELSQFKIDMIFILLKKIIFRLKNYIKK
jgi:hypothetical protein